MNPKERKICTQNYYVLIISIIILINYEKKNPESVKLLREKNESNKNHEECLISLKYHYIKIKYSKKSCK